MPTRSSSSAAFGIASLRLSPWWRSITSVTCRPICTTGFSDDSGSWKIIAISRPRRSRIWAGESRSRSSPSKIAAPSTVLPRVGSSPMIASDVTDLPQPDSPTRPTVWPGRTSKLMPSTALNGSSPRLPNVTRRSRTARSGSVEWTGRTACVLTGSSRALPPGLRVEGLAQ